MTLRVALAGLSHETNTYADASTGTTGIDRFSICRGDEINERYAGTRTFFGGMLDGADAVGATAVPTFAADAHPSGTIERTTYEALCEELEASIERVLPADAIALELHGAGVADGVDDVEADVGRRLRKVVGPDIPLVAVLDLHGNITADMAEVFDLLLGVKLYPHADMYERGRAVVEHLPDLLAGRLRPTIHVERLPMLLPPATTDAGNPAARMNEVCREMERRSGVVDCTVFHGFPYVDVPLVGVHVVVTTDDDPKGAEEAAQQVATWIWDHREEFRPAACSPAEAVGRASRAASGPVVINDTADNPGGGTPGDGTHVLRALLEAEVGRACFGVVYDPEVAAQAHAAGAGGMVDVELGGKHDDLHGAAIRARARVRVLTDGEYTRTAMGAGARERLGLTARLEIDGTDVIVASVNRQALDPAVFLLHGIDVRAYDVVGVKSSHHFRLGFRELASEIITADSPGLTTGMVEIFERRRAPGPLWPRDPGAVYPPATQGGGVADG